MWYQIISKFSENSGYLKGSDTTVLLLVSLVFACMLYVLGNGKKKKLPPGPMGLPIFGYYPFLGKKPQETLTEIVKKYGNVYGFYIGRQYVVLLNDWNAVKEAYGQTGTINRPHALFDAVPYKFGIVGVNGAEWREIKDLSSRSLKDSLQQNHWEDLIAEEISDVVNAIREYKEKPIDVVSFFREVFANQVVALVLGERLPAGHPVPKIVGEAVDAIMEYTPTFSMANFSPGLCKILQMWNLEKDPSLLAKEVANLSKFVSKTVEERIENSYSKGQDSFIDRFNKEVENRRKNADKTFITKDNLKGTVLAVLAGGSETTRTTMVWAFIAMVEHPHMQQKVQEELDSVCGRDESIRWSHRYKLPYTHAVVMEVLRWKTIAPFPAMRIASENIKIQGYDIPKGTFIVTNNWSIHSDTRYWPDPEKFRPERFLTKDGKKVNFAPDSFNPFSYGKRMCPGRLLAFMGIFQYFAALMQNFTICPKEGAQNAEYDELLRLTYQAVNVELRFVPRRDTCLIE